MINRIVSFFILCLVLCIPLCVAYFHSGELMMRFVFFWPFFMSIMWIVGGVYFWVYRERHWPWGENAPAPQLKDNPSISIMEGANKWGNSSRLTQSFHFFMFEPIF
ncbi:poly-beta-1,6 N-acetyl-D-glucosamine synthase, partial [Escherichia coli]